MTSRLARGLVVSLSLALSLVLVELSIRRLGLGPWPRGQFVPHNEPVFHVPDPILGWRNKPGDYRYPPYVPEGSEIRMTINADGSRSTGGAPNGPAPEILLVGCSFTFGQALSDEESLGWKLQQRLPEATVRNLGVGGYGTLQALLLLEERLRETRSPPIVVYGFSDAHELRNVAQPLWIRLLALASRKGMVAVPFATLDAAGELVRHPATPHPQWPLRHRLALVSFLQDKVADIAGARRVRQATAVTDRLLVEMNTVVAKAGGKLLVAMLYGWPAPIRSYENFLTENGIAFADCLPSEIVLPPARLVPGEGHPNASVNQDWADCIARSVQSWK